MTPVSDQAPPGESAAIENIVRTIIATLDRDYPAGTLMRRDAHLKLHGLVRGRFVVDGDAPPDLRHGLFAEPASFPCWVRFSNGAPRSQPDHRKDQRGMALKLLDVPGRKLLDAERDARTHDFLLASAPRFFIRDAVSYEAFARAATLKPPIRVLGYFLGWNPFAWKLHELRALASTLHRSEDVLATRYWSQVPYRLGPHTVKYSTRPLDPPVHTVPDTDPDFLRHRMVAHLRERTARFEFLIQRREKPDAMPVEDATIEWPESQSPFVRVATIEIAPQEFDTPAQRAYAEQLSFTPWHALPVHEPLGNVNRARRAVYEAVSAHRHARNGARVEEPISLDVPAELAT
jgi:catalase